MKIRNKVIIGMLTVLTIFSTNQRTTYADEIKKVTDTKIKSSNNLESITVLGYKYNNADKVYELQEKSDKSIIFVGDSRTVGMNKFGIIDEDATVIAKVGEGHKFLLNNLQSIKDAKDSSIIINLGVNDIGSINKYIETYEELEESAESNSNTIYLLSINPVENYPTISNEQISEFNDKLIQFCDEHNIYNYIDTYSTLVEMQDYTVDGLHYNKETYQLIYDMITDEIN